ncbi:MAG: hypothetical protein RL653_803 [Pseudomonadota bacterium]
MRAGTLGGPSMARILYLEPVGGIAGDMFLAAGLDLGVDRGALLHALSGLGLHGWRLEAQRAERHHIGGTHVDIRLDGPQQPERHLSDIQQLIWNCPTLPQRAKERAVAVFQEIGRAESKVHGIPLESIHFHEVGAVDSILDVCGAAVVLELLGDPEVYAAPPPLGSGLAHMAHGHVPIPPPATVEILTGVPVRHEGVGELTTPTGAALLKVLARVQPPPTFVAQAVGYGVGTKDWPDRANVLRATLGETHEGRGELPGAERAYELAANLDDCSPQLLGYVLERALELGALDAWVVPATFKKGRPGHVVHLLSDGRHRDALRALLLEETPTLGLREQPITRAVLQRRHDEVHTPWGPVRIKLGLDGERVLNAQPEYEDCRRLAREASVPLKVVHAVAMAAWMKR